MKRLVLSLFVGMSLHGAASSKELVEFTEVQAPLNDRLFHDGQSFLVQRMGVTHQVPPYAVDRELRTHDIATLISLQQHGYYQLNRSVEGNEYRLDFKPRLKAGGPVGAAIGSFIGGCVVSFGAWFGSKAIKNGVQAVTGSETAGEVALTAVHTAGVTTGASQSASLKIIMASTLFFAVSIPF